MATSGSFSACGFVLCHNRFKIKIYILTKCKSNLFREIKTISASFYLCPPPSDARKILPSASGKQKPRAAEYSRKIKYLWERKNNLMHLHKLSLIDFKNIAEAHIELSPQINCLVGDKEPAKPTCSTPYITCRSVKRIQFCRFAVHTPRCGRIFDRRRLPDVRRSQRAHRLLVQKKNSQKKLCRGGKEYEKLSDHFGLIPLVMVTPSDTALINESGEERRRYMNSLISQLDRKYLATLVRYNHLLAERNKLLKAQQTPNFSEIMEVIDLQMAALGTDINARRKQLIDELAPHVARYYAALSGDREQIKLKYRSELNQLPFDEILRDAQPQDRANQYTTRGVHRDDLRMTLGDYTLRKYGSQGQQKSFLIALKLAQFDLIAGHSPVRPILLLDDIFDKLDMQRVEQLIRIVTSERFGQIFITDCNKVRLENVLHSNGCRYTLFNVTDGEIRTA